MLETHWRLTNCRVKLFSSSLSLFFYSRTFFVHFCTHETRTLPKTNGESLRCWGAADNFCVALILSSTVADRHSNWRANTLLPLRCPANCKWFAHWTMNILVTHNYMRLNILLNSPSCKQKGNEWIRTAEYNCQERSSAATFISCHLPLWAGPINYNYRIVWTQTINEFSLSHLRTYVQCPWKELGCGRIR